MSGSTGLEVEVAVESFEPGGHLDNVEYLRVVDAARIRVLGRWDRGAARFRDGLLELPEGVQFVAAQQTVQYRREILSHDPVTVRVWFPRVGGSSWLLAAAVLEPGHPEPAAYAECVMVLVDRETRRPRQIEGAFREALLAHGGPAPLGARR